MWRTVMQPNRVLFKVAVHNIALSLEVKRLETVTAGCSFIAKVVKKQVVNQHFPLG